MSYLIGFIIMTGLLLGVNLSKEEKGSEWEILTCFIMGAVWPVSLVALIVMYVVYFYRALTREHKETIQD